MHRPILILVLFLSPGILQAQFIAFWDHVPGTNSAQTHPNTTVTNTILGVNRYTEVVLRDIADGEATPVGMTITNASLGAGASITAADQCSTPAYGTPLYNAFYYQTNVAGTATNYSYVYFGRSLDNGSIQITNASVSYVFRGLNPGARYNFIGGAVRGGDTNSEMARRWTCVEISGADSFVPNMSRNVVTSAQTASLAVNQVAVNFGCNHTPESGDFVGWGEIAPGPDGIFTVTCTRYTGTIPGGSSAGVRAFAITGIRLEETAGAKLSLVKAENGNVTLSWSPAEGTLQQSTDLRSWQTSSLTNGATIPASGRTYWRLRKL